MPMWILGQPSEVCSKMPLSAHSFLVRRMTIPPWKQNGGRVFIFGEGPSLDADGKINRADISRGGFPNTEAVMVCTMDRLHQPEIRARSGSAFAGWFTNINVESWKTTATRLLNAFIRASEITLDNSVNVEEV